jgi:hypothetical protein
MGRLNGPVREFARDGLDMRCTDVPPLDLPTMLPIPDPNNVDKDNCIETNFDDSSLMAHNVILFSKAMRICLA